MDRRSRTGSLFSAAGLVLAALLVYGAGGRFLSWLYATSVPGEPASGAMLRGVVAVTTVFCAVWAVQALATGRTLAGLFRTSALFNVLVTVCCVGLLLASNPYLVAHLRILRVVVVGVALVFLARALVLAVVRTTQPAGRGGGLRNVAVAAFAIGSLALVFEAALMFVPRSHRFGMNLAAKLWFQQHWRVNRRGYRQDPEVFERARTRRRIAVFGDSFVAGHGIEAERDRFTEVLQRRLGDDYAVFNMGVNGDDTRRELKRLSNTRIRPDVVVLTWVPNDIVKVAREAGVELPAADPVWKRTGVLDYVINSSYVASFLFFEFARPDEDIGYLEALQAAYADPDAMASHRRDLLGFVRYGRENGVPIVAVLFPFVQDVAGSRAALEQVQALLEAEGVPVLDVADLIKDRPTNELIVNRNDGHPNETVHREVGNALYELLARNGIASRPGGRSE